jgi:phosphohistidine phosphatase
MKRLLLMRHAKSEWRADDQDDIDRALSNGGRMTMRHVAEWLVAQDLVPDRALVSQALRTRQTWEHLRTELGADIPADIQSALYLASPGTLLAQIEALPDDTETAIVIAHNPGIEELARMLAGPDPDPGAMRDLLRGFPTAGVAVFELNGGSWQSLSADGARLVRSMAPREAG